MTSGCAAATLLLTIPLFSNLQLKAEASASETGTIRGVLHDRTGAVLASVRLSLFDKSSGRMESTTFSNEVGAYQFTDVTFGQHLLVAEKKGFRTFQETVELTAAQAASYDVELTAELEVNCGFACHISKVFHTMIGETASAPPPPQISDTVPIYNALISPSSSNGTVTHIYDGKDTTLTFYIGAMDPANALVAPLWTVDPSILNSLSNLPLIVTFSCDACESQQVQQQVITFVSKEKRSSQGVFHFTPTTSLTNGGQSRLFLDVSNASGVHFNHLAIDVVLESVGVIAQFPEPNLRPLGTFAPASPSGNEPDATITIWKNEFGNFSLTVMPTNPLLVPLFAGKHLKNGQLKVFDSGNFSVEELRADSKDTALVLQGVSDQLDEGLKGLLVAANLTQPIQMDPSTLNMTRADEKKIVDTFYAFGSLVYMRMFNDNDADLGFIIGQLESFSPAGRAARVLIQTNRIAFPWQILHAPQPSSAIANGTPINTNTFWGLQFDLRVDSLNRGTPGLPEGTIRSASDATSVFGTYRSGSGASTSDLIVTRLAKQQADVVKNQMAFQNSLVEETRQMFIDDLEKHHRDLTFLGIFAHGASGWIVSKLPTGETVLQPEAAGPRVIFSTTEPFTAVDITKLPVGVSATSASFLEKSPVVLLNACETGMASVSTVDGLTLPIALLNIGASGVVATEAPVWSPFAYGFGNDLIKQMSKGIEVSSGLRQLRKAYIDSPHNNPLGLLYSYYGSPVVFKLPTQAGQ